MRREIPTTDATEQRGGGGAKIKQKPLRLITFTKEKELILGQCSVRQETKTIIVIDNFCIALVLSLWPTTTCDPAQLSQARVVLMVNNNLRPSTTFSSSCCPYGQQ